MQFFALHLFEGCAREVHFIYPIPIREQPKPRIRAYGDPSLRSTTRNRISQGCSLSPFLFKRVIEIIMEIILYSYKNGDTEIFSHRKLPDPEYAGDVVRLSEYSSKL